MRGRSNLIFWLEKRGIPPEPGLVERIFAAAKRSNRLLRDDEVQEMVNQG